MLLILTNGPVFSAEQEQGESDIQQAVEEAIEPFPETEPTERPGEDGCERNLEEMPLQETTQDLLYSWSCYSFRWFDSWWGTEEDFDENAVSGLVTLGTEWREYDGFDPRFRFRVRAPLPNVSKRWNLVFGRVDEQREISDTSGEDRTFYNPGVIDRGRDDSWLLGFSRNRLGRRNGWDFSLGLRLRFPPAPYAKAQYYYNRALGERSDLRFRQTFFWRSDEGLGTTSRGDIAYGISLKNVMRWEGIVTVSEDTEGAQWFVGQTWYHLFGGNSAFSLLTFAQGETDAGSSLKDFGFNLIWRRPFTRDWLYLSVGPSLTWPREQAEEKRELSLGFGIWLEMEFGDWKYR